MIIVVIVDKQDKLLEDVNKEHVVEIIVLVVCIHHHFIKNVKMVINYFMLKYKKMKLNNNQNVYCVNKNVIDLVNLYVFYVHIIYVVIVIILNILNGYMKK